MTTLNYSADQSRRRGAFSPGVRGGATFAFAPWYPAGYSPVAVAVGDFDSDGRPDLAVTNYWSDAHLLGAKEMGGV